MESVASIPGARVETRRRSSEMTVAIAAAILAGVFTVVGTVLGVVLDHQIEDQVLREVWRKDVAMRLAERSMGRWVRARTVVMAADSSVFKDRWDSYIEEGLTRWNEEYFVLQYGVEKYFPEAAADFDALQESFRELHARLLVYHQSRGNPPRKAEEAAEQQLEKTGKQLRKFVSAILDSVE